MLLFSPPILRPRMHQIRAIRKEIRPIRPGNRRICWSGSAGASFRNQFTVEVMLSSGTGSSWCSSYSRNRRTSTEEEQRATQVWKRSKGKGKRKRYMLQAPPRFGNLGKKTLINRPIRPISGKNRPRIRLWGLHCSYASSRRIRPNLTGFLRILPNYPQIDWFGHLQIFSARRFV